MWSTVHNTESVSSLLAQDDWNGNKCRTRIGPLCRMSCETAMLTNGSLCRICVCLSYFSVCVVLFYVYCFFMLNYAKLIDHNNLLIRQRCYTVWADETHRLICTVNLALSRLQWRFGEFWGWNHPLISRSATIHALILQYNWKSRLQLAKMHYSLMYRYFYLFYLFI